MIRQDLTQPSCNSNHVHGHAMYYRLCYKTWRSVSNRGECPNTVLMLNRLFSKITVDFSVIFTVQLENPLLWYLISETDALGPSEEKQR